MHTRSTPLSPTEVPRTTAPPKTKKQKKLATPIKKKQQAKTPDAPCRTHKAHSNPMPPVPLSFVETPTTPITKKPEITTPGAPCRPQSTLVPSNLMAPMQLCFVGMPFSVLTPLVTHLDFQTQLVCHQLMSAFNVNRARAKPEASLILGTEELDFLNNVCCDPRMSLALSTRNALAIRYHMWQIFEEHMKSLVALKLVCKDMNSQITLDISILGGDCALDLNTRMRAICSMMSMLSDTSLPNHQNVASLAAHAAASKTVFADYMVDFESKIVELQARSSWDCMHDCSVVTFEALKALHEDIAQNMVKEATKYHASMGSGMFCQHDKLIELIEMNKHADLDFPAFGMTPENYTHFCYYNLHSIYGKYWPDRSCRTISPTSKTPKHHGQVDQHGWRQCIHPEKNVQGVHYDRERFAYKQNLLRPAHCDYCRQMPWGAECRTCEDRYVRAITPIQLHGSGYMTL